MKRKNLQAGRRRCDDDCTTTATLFLTHVDARTTAINLKIRDQKEVCVHSVPVRVNTEVKDQLTPRSSPIQTLLSASNCEGSPPRSCGGKGCWSLKCIFHAPVMSICFLSAPDTPITHAIRRIFLDTALPPKRTSLPHHHERCDRCRHSPPRESTKTFNSFYQLLVH